MEEQVWLGRFGGNGKRSNRQVHVKNGQGKNVIQPNRTATPANGKLCRMGDKSQVTIDKPVRGQKTGLGEMGG